MNKLINFARYPDVSPFQSGICAGIAYQVKLPTWLIRMILILMVISHNNLGGTLLILYFIGFFLIPARNVPSDYSKRTGG